MAYWTFHYVKRILETIFLHKCALAWQHNAVEPGSSGLT